MVCDVFYAMCSVRFVTEIRVYGVQSVWDRGIFTGGSSGSVQVPGKNPVPIRLRLAGDLSEHQ